jgi:DNA helicase-2/ATP-dependent DNA helicase PcrA
VSDADQVNENAQVNLLTLHNAKGLEFPYVFLAGMEEGLFPHNRSVNSPEALEEERRLCYVGMTRAEKRLFLTWARYRRRFGGGEQERSARSRFLQEVPQELIMNLGDADDIPQVDLGAERYLVRDTVKRNTFTGKTYNSLENISQFFQDRGVPFQAGRNPAAVPGRQAANTAKPPIPVKPSYPPLASKPALTKPPSGAPPRMRSGMTVNHPKYGTGVVVRREGEGDDAKVTVSFPGHGLKKLVEKYAGLKQRS